MNIEQYKDLSDKLYEPFDKLVTRLMSYFNKRDTMHHSKSMRNAYLFFLIQKEIMVTIPMLWSG